MDADKFKGKYRSATTRLRSWNYAANACYFVTICTRHREHFFGEIMNDEMQLSAIGEVAHQFWCEIPEHHRHMALDEFVVMPNHVHGIVIINREGTQLNPTHESPSNVETRHGASLPSASSSTEASNRFGPLKKGSLQSIINQYKGSVTRWCKKNDHDAFAWQTRYYEHIIRREESLAKIREYIINNPLKWALDRENQSGLWV